MLNHCVHCPACGGSDFPVDSRKSRRCSACGFTFFINAGAAVAVILECDGELLLTVRAEDPGRGALGLPGGFVDPGESLEQALRREVQEEIGLELPDVEYLASYPHSYQDGDVRIPTCDAVFLCRVPERPDVRALDEVSEVRWIAAADIALEDIAFPSLRAAVGAVIDKLQ
jgi:mutator protein MutT